MVSVASLISILCTLIAVSRGKEVTNGQASDQIDSKWFNNFSGYGWYGGLGPLYFSGYNMASFQWLSSWSSSLYGSCYGGGILPYMYNNMYFAKATDKHSVSRRAVSLDADALHRRDSLQTVTCISDKGDPGQFLKSDCLSAAKQLADDKVSTATHGSCTLRLVSAKDQVSPKQVTGAQLEKVADGILKACGNRSMDKRATPSNDPNESHVAMILSKPANAAQ